MKSLLFILCTIICVNTFAVERPSGSYIEPPCQVKGFFYRDGGVLTASCRGIGTENYYHDTRLNVTASCMSGSTVSANDHGQLVCDNPRPMALPEGSYINSCDMNTVQFDGVNLSAECGRGYTTLNYAQCNPGSTVSNRDYKLACDN